MDLKKVLVLAALTMFAAGFAHTEGRGGAPAVEELKILLNASQRKLIGRGKTSPISQARVAWAVPENFDPRRAWPILIVSATSDPEFNSSTDHLRSYLKSAISEGWVVIAADPPTPAPVALDSNELRLGLVLAALEEFERRWPGSESWPIAFAGFSGGSKRSGWLAAMFAARGRVPIGVFQGGCNRPTMVDAIKLYDPPRRKFRQIPVFLSSGSEDPISTPREHELVERALRADGFQNVRLETYPGGHRLHREHVTEALRWFRRGAHPVRPTSILRPRAGRALP